MSSNEDRPRPGRVRWTALLAAALAVAVAAPLLSMRRDLVSLLAVALALACGAVAWLATSRLRPWNRTSAWALVVVVVIAFVSSIGMKPLWLSVVAEQVTTCVVTDRSSHTPRRSPTCSWNQLSCGSRQVEYHPGAGRTTKPVGERIDLAVDDTGLAGYAEPATVRPLLSALVGVAALAGALHVALVLWWPVPKPGKRPEKTKVERGFL